MNNRRTKTSRQKDEDLFEGDHLTEGALLQSLDGELSPARMASVEQHIQSCWSCRAGREDIAQSIVDLVAYQNAMSAPHLQSATQTRAVFLSRLEALATEIGKPSPLKTWTDRVFRFFTPGPVSQVAWLVAMLLSIATGSAFYFLRAPKAVSANEVMNAMDAAEAQSVSTANQPVVVQKLRIRHGRSEVARTIYRDVVHNRSTSRGPEGGAELKHAFLTSSLDWDAPLSAATYRRWRTNHQVIKDTVRQLDNGTLVLESIPAAGPVTSIDLTIRKSDYHAIEESFHLRDDSEVEVAELSYGVVPFASLPANIFGLPTNISRPELRTFAVARPVLPSGVLAASQVEVDAALHRVGADLGEQISITTHPGRDVSIDGIVADEDAKGRLVEALRAIPHTRLNLLTTDEALQKATPSTSQPVQAAATPVRVMVATPPLLEAQLNSRFPVKDQQIAYVNETLSLVQSASARAWALNRLANRYSVQQMSQLDESSRQKLNVLLTDHVSAMREDISSLQNQLGEILSNSSNTPAANTVPSFTAETHGPGAEETTEDWRDRSRRIHSSTETIHEAVISLLTSSQPSDKNDAEAIEINLRTSLTQIQTELLTLDQKLRKSALK